MIVAPVVLVSGFLWVATAGLAFATPATPQTVSDSDRRIWPEFVSLLKDGRIGGQHVRAAYVPESAQGHAAIRGTCGKVKAARRG